MAKSTSATIETLQSEIDRLQAAVTNSDALAQEILSEIRAIANLSLVAMEIPDSYHRLENIALALRTIRNKADDLRDLIGSEAESVDCAYEDTAYIRRAQARNDAFGLGRVQ